MAAESFSDTAIILKTLIAAREETLELQRLENNPLGHHPSSAQLHPLSATTGRQKRVMVPHHKWL